MKNSFTYIFDALHMTQKLDRGMLPVIAAASILRAVTLLIATLVTAFVLDRLAAGTSFGEMMPTVLGSVVLVFVINLIASRLEQYKDAHTMAIYYKWETLIGEKSMSLDYSQLEDPEVTQIRDRMHNDRNWGSGIANTFWLFGLLVGDLAGLAFSFVILAPLLSDSVFFHSPMSYGYIISALVISGGVLVYKLTYEKKQTTHYMNESPVDWKPVMGLIWGGTYDYRHGKDVRIYNAKNLIRNASENPGYQAEAKRGIATVSNAIGLSGALTGLSEALIMGGAYLLTSLLAVSGGLTIGVVVRSAAGLYQLMRGISGLIVTIGNFAGDTQRLQSFDEYQAVPEVMYKGKVPVEKRRDNDYVIAFHDVSFMYPGTETYALRNVSLKLQVGERMAVVGENGSGKTTMIKLLCRLYDPTQGVITLNGVDIKKYNYAEYMDIFSIVFQDFQLFSFTLGQNVAALAAFDTQRAEAALTMAGLHDRLERMPKGLDTPLYKDYEEDGVEVSGGEAQKIALARALYKNAPFIILDEPTAALDPIAEFEIYSKFDEIVGGKTAIYISHRLSSCRFCDDIAVFHKGALVQRGNHEALIDDKNGKYFDLWNAQAQYYTDKAM